MSAQTSPNSSSGNSTNSGSQYATCALGVGLVALGMVMIVWSVVPSDAAVNGSKPGLDSKGKTSSVAFVLVGTGVSMLLVSLCLGMRNKRRHQQHDAQGNVNTQASSEDGRETAEEHAERFNVPSYEEAVGSGQYPVRQSNPRNNSTSQLPSYEDLVEGAQAEAGAHSPQTAQPQLGPTAAATGRRNGRPGRKLLPLKIRRIKSEKLRLKSANSSPQTAVFSIEPLTPPPQYDDRPPEL